VVSFPPKPEVRPYANLAEPLGGCHVKVTNGCPEI
jgi:hypothetical protein